MADRMGGRQAPAAGKVPARIERVSHSIIGDMSEFAELKTPGLHEILARRWSPRSYSQKPVEAEKVRSLFEAVRWSASCFNEQPWRFLVATREEPAEFARLLGLLVEKNQAWAKDAWVLGITTGKRTFTLNGAPNRFGLHDAGMALTSLMLQATASGLQAHGMGGFDAERARLELGIPEDFEVGAAFAVGYPEGTFDPPGGRSRKSIGEIIFSGGWGKAALIG